MNCDAVTQTLDAVRAEQLAPVVTGPLVTTETSAQMAANLRRKGFECWETDIAAPTPAAAPVGADAAQQGGFELVAMLNVIDRTQRPAALLAAAHALLEPEPGGWLLLATPLPYRPFYFRGASTYRPDQDAALALPDVTSEAAAWEEQAFELLAETLPRHGFAPRAFTRLPYLSAGDPTTPLWALDDLVCVAQRV